ncbi:nitrogen regulation protein NR(I) [Hyphomicrobiales bacterium 4NK60-0047b]
MPNNEILIADDDAAIRTVLTQALSRAGYSPRATSNAATLWRWAEAGDGDLIITDVVMPDENAFNLIPQIKKQRPELPIIVMSAENTIMTAIKASEKGAFDYLPKPFDLTELMNVIERALEEPAKPNINKVVEEDNEQLPLIGRSIAMQDIYRIIARVMKTDLSVMIRGESGTGKELVARALHDFSNRVAGPFVAINMAAIPRELIESELFGHEKGAFTGAQGRHIGRFEQAEGGTLFLDEIGDMPLEAQTRLLRVLQEGEYTRVGGRVPIKTNVRIVAATHRDLQKLIHAGTFREDLYYRLNVVPIKVPPLRSRLDDISDLAHHFLRKAEEQGLPVKRFEPDAIKRMQTYQWPGNVRELENFVQRITALHPEEIITKVVVEEELSSSISPSDPVMIEEKSLPGFVANHLQNYFTTFGADLPPPGLYDRVIKEVEKPLILAALAATNGNQIKASDLLGINRNTLRKKIRDLDIQFHPIRH